MNNEFIRGLQIFSCICVVVIIAIAKFNVIAVLLAPIGGIILFILLFRIYYRIYRYILQCDPFSKKLYVLTSSSLSCQIKKEELPRLDSDFELVCTINDKS